MTTTDQTRPTLTIQQETALHALLNGASQQQASIEAGVARTTVTNWVNHFIPFIQEMNRQRNERRQRLGEHGVRVAERALEVVEDAINQGDSKLAMQYLSNFDLASVVGPPRALPETPLGVTSCLANQLQDQIVLDSLIPDIVRELVEGFSIDASRQSRLP